MVAIYCGLSTFPLISVLFMYCRYRKRRDISTRICERERRFCKTLSYHLSVLLRLNNHIACISAQEDNATKYVEFCVAQSSLKAETHMQAILGEKL